MTHVLTQFGGRMHRGDRFGFHPLMGILLVVVIAAAGALIVWMFRSRTPAVAAAAPAPGVAPTTTAAPSPTAHAEAILAERLARGEVSPADYREILAALRGAPADDAGTSAS
jgi:uncharacterized membrane protein